MLKKLSISLVSLSLVLSILTNSYIFAEATNEQVPMESLGQAIQEYNIENQKTFENESEDLKERVLSHPEDPILAEAAQYLDIEPEVKENTTLDYFSTEIVLFDSSGKGVSLESYVDQLDAKASTNKSIAPSSAEQAISPQAQGGVVFTNELTGNLNNRNIVHTVKYVSDIGSVPDKVSVDNYLFKSTSRNGTYTKASYKYNNAMKKGSTLVNSLRAETKYWKGNLIASIYDNGVKAGGINRDTGIILYNNAALPYYKYVDTFSGKVNIEPASTTWQKVSNPVTWDNDKRGAYISWYISTYGNPNITWGGYDIHHIKPREYGGSNANSNLMPVPRNLHNSLISPWWASYNKG
ncbi:HNH endonuclease signature motif containing protein [Paenibacillus sp. PsM32]|uniref:HNH endonuclease signature motif containing protein n=1 Tax=Paenibacillus sp. PsM32 TaxID=3030536 RepID=UPI00263A7B60|nr:HNH endonuclease signature motif containing protein [Paenibacillus sp. PsM32]MDN4620255.1 HNH endonuclease signature motif containing protein [Paenibacillus sp. PsM32]